MKNTLMILGALVLLLVSYSFYEGKVSLRNVIAFSLIACFLISVHGKKKGSFIKRSRSETESAPDRNDSEGQP